MTYGGGYYPPGTPGPRSYTHEFTCKDCGHKQTGGLYWELGGWFLEGPVEDGCEKCGGDWEDDSVEVDNEPDPDAAYEQMLDRRADEAHDPF